MEFPTWTLPPAVAAEVDPLAAVELAGVERSCRTWSMHLPSRETNMRCPTAPPGRPFSLLRLWSREMWRLEREGERDLREGRDRERGKIFS